MDKKKLETLVKGAVRRLHGPFNPRSREYNDTASHLEDWQGLYSTPEGRERAWEDKPTQAVNERHRAFNKLSARTKTRRNQETGEREFLLHRGMGQEEKNGTVSDTHVSNPSVSSWTPHQHIARGFADVYGPYDKGHVASAWIPESKIKGIPNQLGVNPEYKEEHEVLVHPITAKLAHPQEMEKPATDIRSRHNFKKMQKAVSNTNLTLKNDQSFPEHKLTSAHSDPQWSNYYPELVNGLEPNKNLKNIDTSGRQTKIIKFVGNGDGQIKSVIKPPLDWKDLGIGRRNDENGRPRHVSDVRQTQQSYFMHPNFRSSHREAAFHKAASEFFGLGQHVPKATVFRHPRTNQPWSATEYIEGRHVNSPEDIKNTGLHTNDLQKLAIMDTILGNNDRNRSNMLIDNKNNKLKLIDNAGSFDYTHKFKMADMPHMPAYLKHAYNSPVDSNVHKWIKNLKPQDLYNTLVNSGAPKPVAEMARRRLEEAHRWSNNSLINRSAAKDISGLLLVMGTHRFNPWKKTFIDEETKEPIENNSLSQNNIRQMQYNRINRGEPYSQAPAAQVDKTKLNDKTFKV